MSIYIKESTSTSSKLCVELLDVYPVGSIYISVNSTNPGDLFGGTWVIFGEGRTLVGVYENVEYESQWPYQSSEIAGGEETHKLTTDELPSHSHDVWSYISGGSSTFHTGSGPAINSTVVWSSKDQNNYQMRTATKGSGKAHNNMPPYITVYMWKRTA